MLLRYRYLQPVGGRYHYGREAGDAPAFRVAYAGSIPAGEGEATEEVLERLWQRHSSELSPHGRGERPFGTGDALDLGERGVWQAVPLGFRALTRAQLRVEEAA